MNREHFLERVKSLRQDGMSIRAIASELGTYKNKVDRALKLDNSGQENGHIDNKVLT